MDILIFQKIIISIIAFLFISLFSHVLKRTSKEISLKRGIKKTRYFAVKRLISFVSVVILITALILIWGVNIKDLWVSVAGLLAMVAVAFVAVWSLVGNILAGLILYFTTPFKINDVIEVLPDGIKGKVLAINTFYTVISEEDENYINIPNSLFFQKYVRNIRKK
jgi:small-conductance mechanosensitive channel